jgi:lysophospholipase L1-like esterase
MMSGTRRAALLLGLSLLATPVFAKAPPVWVGTWASAQMTPGADSALSPADATDVTLRQIVRVTKGGDTVRIKLSNVMSNAPLRLQNVHVARALSSAGAAIDAASDRTVTFGGMSDIVIPAGADYLSDPVAIPLPDQADLAISFHMAAPPAQQTGHPGSRATSYLARGDHSAEADLPGATAVNHWFHIAGVDVLATPNTRAIVTFGDSITDGYGITPNSNRRFPDRLAERLKGHPLTVLNAGIGGNRLLLDGSGANALARFDRDVLSQSGVGYVIVLEGVNDLGMLTKDAPATPEAHAAMVSELKAAYLQMIAKARSHGMKIYGGTITPYMGMDFYHAEPVSEADRQTINSWIRTSGAFDAVIDFDAALRDPARPDHLKPEYDSGDHIHPSEAGYKAMADAVSLTLFGIK